MLQECMGQYDKLVQVLPRLMGSPRWVITMLDVFLTLLCLSLLKGMRCDSG